MEFYYYLFSSYLSEQHRTARHLLRVQRVGAHLPVLGAAFRSPTAVQVVRNTLLALFVWSTLRASPRLSCCNLPESSSQSTVNAAKVYSGGIALSRFAESQSVRS